MGFGSVITVLLYVSTKFSQDTAYLDFYGLEIGGMNETELYDIKQLARPDSESQGYDSWSAKWKLQGFTGDQNDYIRMSSPPLKSVAPFLSRIKTWGYKITFYENYQDSFGLSRPNPYRSDVPSIVHSWILEK